MGMGYGMVQENNKLFDENCVGEGNAGGFAGGTFPVDFPCSGVIPFQGALQEAHRSFSRKGRMEEERLPPYSSDFAFRSAAAC